jgi:mono/diheme cytochrome c family protein
MELADLSGRCWGLLFIFVLAAGTASAGDDPGRQLYLRYCAACHGRDARGDGPVAPALGEKPTDLTRIAAEHGGTFPTENVVEAIDGTRTVRAHGVSEMPVWGEVLSANSGTSAQRLAARRTVRLIAEYLRSVQTGSRSSP